MSPAPDPSGRRIAVCDKTFCGHEGLRAELRARYPLARFSDPSRTLQGDALVDFIGDASAAIIGLSVIDDAALARMPGLAVVSKFGVGVNNLDFQALARRGVRVGWTPGVNRRSVAEFAIGQLITLLRGLHLTHADVLAGGWARRPGRQLDEVTIGVLGCGMVGQEITRLLRAFGARVLATDIRDVSGFCCEVGAAQVPLEALLAQADALTVHLPLTEATRGLLDAAALARMPAGAVLVNTARGGIVDEAALVEALRSGRLSGAAMDVYEVEPAAGNALLALPTFRASAHVASGSDAGVWGMGRAAIAGLDSHRPALEVLAQIRALGGLG